MGDAPFQTRMPAGAVVPGRTVLHVTQPTSGGVARFVLDLAAAQRADGWRVVVASPPDASFVEQLRESGVDHVAWDASRNPGLATAREARTLRALARDVRPDVAHLHSSKAGLAGRVSLRGVAPLMFQPHAWSFEAATGFERAASLRWERLAARWANLVLCVSEAERDRGIASGIRGRYQVVYNGIDLERFPFVDASATGAAKARLGFDDAPLVVCVGRLCRQKGQDALLAAWPRVTNAVGDARLVLVGDGPDRDALEAAAPPGVTFVGHRDDIPAWLTAADVVAMPSRWEGMAYTVLEAMAVGRSIVAFDVDGVRESLGDAGALVAQEDAHGLARAIVARLRDPALVARDAHAARVRVERSHDARDQLAVVMRLAAMIAEPRSDNSSRMTIPQV